MGKVGNRNPAFLVSFAESLDYDLVPPLLWSRDILIYPLSRGLHWLHRLQSMQPDVRIRNGYHASLIEGVCIWKILYPDKVVCIFASSSALPNLPSTRPALHIAVRKWYESDDRERSWMGSTRERYPGLTERVRDATQCAGFRQPEVPGC